MRLLGEVLIDLSREAPGDKSHLWNFSPLNGYLSRSKYLTNCNFNELDR